MESINEVSSAAVAVGVPLLSPGGMTSAARPTTSRPRLCGRKARQHSAVDWLFVQRLSRLFRLMTPRFLSIETLLFVGLIVLVCGNEVLVYFVGLLPSQLIRGLIERDAGVFFDILWRAAVFTISEAIILSLVSLLSGFLALRWRERLVTALHAGYLARQNFYRINQFLAASVDNPDQRVVEDANLLCSALSSLFQSAAVPLVIVFYTWRVAAVMGYMGPVTIYAYFLLGSLLNKVLMSRVAEAVWRQERLEGSFRFAHARLRAASEQIALYRGGQQERFVLDSSLAAVLSNAALLLRRRFALDVSRNAFAYIGGFLSYVVVGLAMRYGGAFENLTPAELAAVLQQASFLSIMLISAFSSLVALTSAVSDLAGYTARVAGLNEALEQLPPARHVPPVTFCSDRLECVDLCLAAPDGLVLLERLSFVVLRGRSLLITGPSGSGKSSLARVMHGLWPVAEGQLVRPPDDELCFVPQEPYLVAGSLADQVCYPHSGSPVSSERLLELLTLVRLPYLAERYRLDEVCDWNAILSPGERQKLGMARLLFSDPQFAVLDEASSAMSLDDEEYLYRLLVARGLTLISIGHRPSLLSFHACHLAFDGRGGYTLADLVHSDAQ